MLHCLYLKGHGFRDAKDVLFLSFETRQEDFKVSATKRRRDELTILSISSFRSRAPLSITQVSLVGALRKDENVNLLNKRTSHIRHT